MDSLQPGMSSSRRLLSPPDDIQLNIEYNSTQFNFTKAFYILIKTKKNKVDMEILKFIHMKATNLLNQK